MTAPDTETFFEELFGTAPEDHYAALWCLPDRISHYVALTDGTAPLAERAAELAAAGKDVYVQMCTTLTPGPPDRRISADQAAGMVGLWADLDHGKAATNGKHYPPTQAAALRLIDRMQTDATLVVNSGHGLHAYWLFQEFYVFDDEDDRARMADLSQHWARTLECKAAQVMHSDGVGYSVDSVYDLARVLRVPGTLNHKDPDDVVQVSLLPERGHKYQPDHLQELTISEKDLAAAGIYIKTSETDPSQNLKVVVDRHVDVTVLLEALCAEDPQFRKTWEHRRTDLGDESTSGYDYAIINAGIKADLDDQKIVDLVVAHRVKYGSFDKLVRNRAYLTRSIIRARVDTRKSQAELQREERIQAAVEDLDKHRESGDTVAAEETQQGLLVDVSAQLTCPAPAMWFRKLGPDKPSYRLEFANGDYVWFEGVENLSNPTKFADAMLGSRLNLVIPKFTKDEHRTNILVPLMRCVTVEDLGPESSTDGETSYWLENYFNTTEHETPEECSGDGHPIELPGGAFGVNTTHFLRHLQLEQPQSAQNRERLIKRLHVLGVYYKTVAVIVAKKRTTRGVYVVPVRLLQRAIEEEPVVESVDLTAL